MMNKQIKLYMLDVKDFYTETERDITIQIAEATRQKELFEQYSKLSLLGVIDDSFEDYKDKKELYKNLNTKVKKEIEISESESIDYENLKKHFNTALKSINVKRSKKFRLSDKDKQNIEANEDGVSKKYKTSLNGNKLYIEYKDKIKELKVLFKAERRSNESLTRVLNRNRLYYQIKDDNTGELIEEKAKVYKQIALFDSSLTRTLDLKKDELTEDIFIVETIYYDIIEQLIKNNFTYNNEVYCVFSSSSGQLRKKKVVMIKKSVLDNYKNRIMCGLSLEDINSYQDEDGNMGSVVNKYLAYLSLTSTASDIWKDFDISQAICVDDFETEVKGLVDYINNETFEIALNVEKAIKINHSDGAGLYLSTNPKDKAFQFRLPWMKGLMIPVPKESILGFCKNANGGKGQYKVTDVDGYTWDLQKDDKKYIFTKSQFKMLKYYKDKAKKQGKGKKGWELYQELFTQLECEACKLNIEPDKFIDKESNYQFLQTITGMTEQDANIMIAEAFNEIKTSYSNTKVMLNILGAIKSNKKLTAMQEALILYPELLHDSHVKSLLSGAINSKKKKIKSGKFIIKDTKRMFIMPDVYAWLEFLIEGNKNPKGLLEDGQVSCNLYNHDLKLDVLRSPSLFKEHAININKKKNDKGESFDKWFMTNGLYTSCKTLMSKLLMYDVDGDEATVISSETWIRNAEDTMKDVRPLYYELGVGKPEVIDNNSIWESMKTAWKYGNIGVFSNRLTKIWNKENISDKDIKLAKQICFINNASIDCAKTKWMPEIPPTIKKQLDELDKTKLPYFFMYAKDKERDKVEDLNNSIVNRICEKIEDIKDNEFTYDFNKVGKFYVKTLLNNPKIDKSEVNKEFGQSIIDRYEEMNETKNKWFIKVKNTNKNDSDEDEIIASKSGIIYQQCKQEILSVCEGVNINDVVDIIIKYVYSKHINRSKSLLWTAFGDVIVENIKKNVKDTLMCPDCVKRVKRKSNNQVRCTTCAKKDNIKKTIKRKSVYTKIA